jgi:hypothetical protein
MDTLEDLVPSLKNTVSRPGTFATFFPETTDDDLILVLRDGLAEAQMHGLQSDLVAEEDGTLSVDVPAAVGGLILLFSAARLIQAELFNRVTNRRYRAGTAEFEETQATNILRDILKGIENRKTAIISELATGGGTGFFMADAYGVRTSGLDRFFDPLGL